MTRLDPAGEPSMEDILASIRKIIAEDPPGTRAATEAKPQSLPASERLVVSRSLREPDFLQPAPAPAAAPDMVAQEPAPVALPAPAPMEARNAFPSLSSGAMDMGRLARSAASRPFAEPAPASVDDQLSALLGDAPAAAAVEPVAAAAPGVAAAGSEIESADEFLAKLTRRAATGDEPAAPAPAQSPVPARPEPKLGFTVSRDGFVPAAATPAAERDPFEFTLEPSPFHSKSAAQSPAPPAEAAPAPAPAPRDLGAFVPSRYSESSMARSVAPLGSRPEALPVQGQGRGGLFEGLARPFAEPAPAKSVTLDAPAPDVHAVLEKIEASTKEPAAETGIVDVAEPAAPSPSGLLRDLIGAPVDAAPAPGVFAKTEPAGSPPAPEPEVIEAVVVPAAGPILVTATEARSAEVAEAVDAAVEPVEVAGREAVPAPIVAAEAVMISATPGVAPAPQSGMPAPAAPMAATAHAAPRMTEMPVDIHAHETLKPAASLTASLHDDHIMASEPAEGGLEDAVADLLRPMLRSWLAENMPRILERALRKELAEGRRIEHKPAAE